jgi:hypothetical protein
MGWTNESARRYPEVSYASLPLLVEGEESFREKTPSESPHFLWIRYPDQKAFSVTLVWLLPYET